MKKAIITVVGKDTIGIIAKICNYLAENHMNILDISQTIVQDYFNMMMIVDMNQAKKPFVQICTELEETGETIWQVMRTIRGSPVLRRKAIRLSVFLRDLDRMQVFRSFMCRIHRMR